MTSRRHTAWLAIGAIWITFAVLSGLQTWLAMITHGHSVLRMIGYQLAVWSFWAALTPVVLRLVRRFPVVPPRPQNVLVHILAAVVAAIGHGAIWTALTIWIKPYDAMTIGSFGKAFPLATFGRLPFELVLYAAVLGAALAVDYYERSSQLEQSLSTARLHALELQIQPHFLFNTLNAVSALVRGRQNDEAVTVIAGLSDLLRYTLDHAGDQRVPLEQEASMLQRYLEIQQVRFSDRLDVVIDIEAGALRAAVPTLILQPLAENAIRHGVSRSAAAGKIEVRAFRDDTRLRIEMFNSGALREGAPRGIGLRNTMDRLRQLYGEAHAFDLRNANGGVLATIAIPWSETA